MGFFPGQPDRPLPLQGKVFPKLRKRSSMRSVDVEELGMRRATDYVFRIIYPGHKHEHSECSELSPCKRREVIRGLSAASPKRVADRSTDQTRLRQRIRRLVCLLDLLSIDPPFVN